MAAVLSLGGPACKPACGERGGACAVEAGTYFALPPADWDGRPLPMAMLLHGYSSTPEGIFDKADLAEAARIAPQLMRSMLHDTHPSAKDVARRNIDIGFASAVKSPLRFSRLAP